MSYALAKELKDAGFPQKYVRGQMKYDPNVEADEDGILPEETEEVFHPTLSELIEACGDGFVLLVRHKTDEWYARSKAQGWDDFESDGKTPEEAVANLYLALNKK